jgi:methyltransferase (TIGR00027 family)
MRALHQQLPAEARILDDPIAAMLVDPQGDAFKARVSFVAQLPEPVRLRLTNFVLRSRYAEDCLAQAAQDGIAQYVLLGSGLDTFGYRQPAWARRLNIIEVDHPATQDAKRKRLRDAGIVVPDNIGRVP